MRAESAEGDTQISDVMLVDNIGTEVEKQFGAWYTYQKEGESNVFHLDMMMLRFLCDINFEVSSRKHKREMRVGEIYLESDSMR